MDARGEKAAAAVERAAPPEFEPLELPERMRGESPELADLLAHPSLVETARRYVDRDRLAVREKARFLAISKRATVFVLVGTVTSALLVSSSSLPALLGQVDAEGTHGGLRAMRIALVVLTTVFGGYALFGVTYLSRSGLARRFREARATAEAERLGYFNVLAERASAAWAGRPELLLMTLELFRRLQVKGQETFYRQRCETGLTRHHRTVLIASWAVVILAFGSGGFGIAGLARPELLPLASLSAIGAALATFASQREAVFQDEGTVERYGRTLRALGALEARHAEVQVGLAEGRVELLESYVAAVHEQLALEHREWLEDSKALDTAARSLAEALENRQ